jgi:hydroxyacylglutathione hydrolase
MLTVTFFTFGPFQENTFVVHSDNGECVVIDPGCFNSTEQQELKGYIAGNKLKVIHLLNTHCHVDHVAGNAFVHDSYGVLPEIHKADLVTLESQERVSAMYGLPCDVSPAPGKFLGEGDFITIGNDKLKVIFTPGHAPGHVVFYCAEQKFVINGDVLFNGSIGRTDLPNGDFDTLEHSIRTKMYSLPDDTVVYCGHGPETTIGQEKRSNPFVNLL